MSLQPPSPAVPFLREHTALNTEQRLRICLIEELLDGGAIPLYKLEAVQIILLDDLLSEIVIAFIRRICLDRQPH